MFFFVFFETPRLRSQKCDHLGQNLVKQRNDPQPLWLVLSNLVYSRTKLKRSYETPEKEAVNNLEFPDNEDESRTSLPKFLGVSFLN